MESSWADVGRLRLKAGCPYSNQVRLAGGNPTFIHPTLGKLTRHITYIKLQLRAASLRFAAEDARGPDRAPIRVPQWDLKPVTRPRDLDYPASRPKHGGKRNDEESPLEQLDHPVEG
jgi:hypothetical protein